MMLENVNVLLFDFTRENLDEHEEAKVNLTSGKNVLEDLIQFEDGEFCESPFVQCIQIPTDDPYNQIPDEQMSDILGIDYTIGFLLLPLKNPIHLHMAI